MRLLAVMLAVLAVAAPAAATTGGLRGIVLRGPIVPVCTAESPCDAPARHVVLTFKRNGVTRSVTTGDDGRYLIWLRSGTWSVEIAGARFGYRPTFAYVRAGVVRTQNFSIDTGIR